MHPNTTPHLYRRPFQGARLGDVGGGIAHHVRGAKARAKRYLEAEGLWLPREQLQNQAGSARGALPLQVTAWVLLALADPRILRRSRSRRFFSRQEVNGSTSSERGDQSMTAANLDTALSGGAHELRFGRPDRPLSPTRPSILRRIVRACARFLFAVLVGVGATLAWQSYGDEVVDMIRTQAPSLVEWLPASTGKPADAPLGAAQPQLKPALAAADQQLPAIGPAGSAELEQRLKPLAIDLTAVKETLERITADQEKLTQSIDRLERGQQAIAQKLSSVAAPNPVVHAPTPRPVQHPAQPAAQSATQAPSRPVSVPSPPVPRQ